MIFRLTILWGRGEGLCPGIMSKFTLLRWMMVIEDPYFGDMVRLVALKCCRWTEELLSMNIFQIYLKDTFLPDLATGDGKLISPKFWSGNTNLTNPQ